MDTDKLLEQYGLKYEDLNNAEKETLTTTINSIQKNQLTVEKIKEAISVMKASVEQELTKCDLTKEQDLFLKARLRNYLLLENFLTSPAKAKQMLEQMLQNVKSSKGVILTW
jgi:hypothetical protein